MPERRYHKGCGHRCVRCWENRQIHSRRIRLTKSQKEQEDYPKQSRQYQEQKKAEQLQREAHLATGEFGSISLVALLRNNVAVTIRSSKEHPRAFTLPQEQIQLEEIEIESL